MGSADSLCDILCLKELKHVFKYFYGTPLSTYTTVYNELDLLTNKIPQISYNLHFL